jgi:ABC-type branched-subunit amino acid transport system substrate-binding protein
MRVAARVRRVLLQALLAAAVPASLAAGSAPFSEQELAGRRLFREGVGASGSEVSARVGVAATPVPGRVVPCAGCHGSDGLGRAESGVQPPAITWSELTKPYGHRHDNGRAHPAFDVPGVLRAVTLGTDPAGNPLDRAMPRYALGREDQDNLVAYLKRLEQDLDPGVHAQVLRVGTLLPLSGPLADSGRLVQRVLEAYLADLNEAGGLYGRRLELVAADAAAARGEHEPRWLERIDCGDMLALLAPMTPGAEAELQRLAETHRVPVVGPLGPGANPGDALPRYSFFVHAGLRDMVRTLVAYAAASLAAPGAPLLLVAPDDAAHEALAAALRSQCERARCGPIAAHRYRAGGFDAAAALGALRASGAGMVHFLGAEGDLAAFLRAADEEASYPTVLLPGALGARAAARAPAGFAGRIVLAYPWSPEEALRSGSRFDAFRTRHGLPAAGVATQAAAYASAALFVEGVRRSGRAVGRERLVESLQSLRAFRTEASPPLSYGPDRRVGALGGHVVALESGAQFRTVSAWQALD